MMIFTLDQIKEVIDYESVLGLIEEGFVCYSQGLAVIPPVGYLGFDDPPGDVHIKCGYVKGDDYYIIKIASGFYENHKVNLQSHNGLILIFNQRTGELVSILLDEAYLTNVRTGAAGAIAAKYLSPKNVRRIGMVGAGQQARFQLEFLKHVVSCREVIVWGRDQARLDCYRRDLAHSGYNIQSTQDIDEVAATCNLIVTTTPASSPVLFAHQVKEGTHVTAVGADGGGKQELDPLILRKADLVVADSIRQCVDHGEISHAIRADLLRQERVVELGMVIEDPKWRRSSEEQITVADLTGVAVQDIQVAKLAKKALLALYSSK